MVGTWLPPARRPRNVAERAFARSGQAGSGANGKGAPGTPARGFGVAESRASSRAGAIGHGPPTAGSACVDGSNSWPVGIDRAEGGYGRDVDLVRGVAADMAGDHRVEILQRDRPVTGRTWRGPVRIRAFGSAGADAEPTDRADA